MGRNLSTLEVTPLLDGLTLGEGPRWHDGKLWFSDVYADRVVSLAEDGAPTVEVETERPSGLGWLPDGRLLISILGAARLERVDEGGVTVVHDLSDRGVSTNDMVVGADGRAYADLYRTWEGGPAGEILTISPDGDVRTAAPDIEGPNGLAITPDGSTLIASVMDAGALCAFTILPDGGLDNRRIFAKLSGERRPDGICLDAEGAVWVASYNTGEFLRILEGGEITHRIETPDRWAVAPALGGADRRTLYLFSIDVPTRPLSVNHPKGRLETARVDVPGAGWP
jgi:sugar lactone lactonase YvrE